MNCASKCSILAIAGICGALGWLAGSGRLSFDRPAQAGPPAAAPAGKSCCEDGEGRAAQFVSAGAYTDRVTVTVNY